MTQCEILEKLVSRKSGVTALEIIQKCGTVAPHRRIADLREKGWAITRKTVKGRAYGTYHGVRPEDN